MEDELTSIQKLLSEQQGEIGRMMGHFMELNNRHRKGLSGSKYLKDANSAVISFLENVGGMLKSSRETQAAVSRSYCSFRIRTDRFSLRNFSI